MCRFNCFIKKISIIVLVLFMFNGHMAVFARAGGGGSSGGGGGASGGSSHSSFSRSGGYGQRSNPVLEILNIGLFIFIAIGGTIIFKVRLEKKKIQSTYAIRNLSKDDDNWDYRSIKEDIKESFYKIQNAWMERNQDLAKEYMSDKLYDEHRMKTEWMEVKKQKNILKNVKLLKWNPIGLEDYEGTDNDSLWVYIKAKAIDYIIDEETNKVIEGSKYRRLPFEEYWKFIRRGNRWVLDEIRQTDDISDLDFFGVDVDNKKDIKS